MPITEMDSASVGLFSALCLATNKYSRISKEKNHVGQIHAVKVVSTQE